jgi:putative ABC transport system permease protein
MFSELRRAVRQVRRSPVFAVIAIGILALGIGANTAMYSFLSAVLLRPLPVRQPDRLVLIRAGSDDSFSHPMFEDFRDRDPVFASVMASASVPLQMTGGERGELIRGELVSGNYFQGLGVSTAIGRALTPDDDRTPNGHPICVISYGFWQRAFGGAASAVGGSLLLNGQSFRILGVAREGFYGTELSAATDIFVPVMMAPALRGYRLGFRGTQWLSVLARLKPGISIGQAEAATDALYRRISLDEIGANGAVLTDSIRKRVLDRRIVLAGGRYGFGEMQPVTARSSSY